MEKISKKIKIKCITCNKDFFTIKYFYDRNLVKNCSRKCSLIWRKINKKKPNNCKCINCNKEFYLKPFALKHGRGNFCNRKCQCEYKSKLLTKLVTCEFCNKIFKASLSRIKRGSAKHCSRQCADKNRPLGENNFNYSQITRFCLICNKEFKSIKCRVKQGKALYCSKKCLGKAQTKENAPGWKGGLTSENARIKYSLEYKKWRLNVFKRDGFKCQKCGDNKGHNLNAHHIKSFSLYPELRLDINNGITLCEKCHDKEHKGKCDKDMYNLRYKNRKYRNKKNLFETKS